MNSLQIINEQNVLGKDFKIYGTFEEPMFLAKDVAEWIEYDPTSINKMLNTVDEDEKLNGTLFLSGQNRNVWFLTEDGLYEVLMQSRKPIAKQFKKQVKAILKGLRTKQLELVTPSYLIEDPIKRAEQWIVEQKEKQQLQLENEMQQQQINEYEPKINYLDTILNNKSLLTVTQISKDYGMSAIEFNQLLHSLGVQFKKSGQWFLYAKYQTLGYTHSRTHKVTNEFGYEIVKMNTKWTQKGRIFLYDTLKENGYLPLIEQE